MGIANAFRSQLIQRWRNGVWITVTSKVRRNILSGQPQDVRSVSGMRQQWKKYQEEQ
jgi:hypothetical protein